MSYAESLDLYAEVLDAVVNDGEEVVITRAGHDPVVIVALDAYTSLMATADRWRHPANAPQGSGRGGLRGGVGDVER
jgi:antitoxin YefM